METPAQILFHQMPASPALEAEVHRHIAELDALHDRITSCRVVIGAPHRHKSHGHLFSVHVDLRLPGAELHTDHAGGGHRAHHDDPYIAVRDAFRAARRQLESFLARRRESPLWGPDANR